MVKGFTENDSVTVSNQWMYQTKEFGRHNFTGSFEWPAFFKDSSMQFLDLDIKLPDDVKERDVFYFIAIRKKLNFDYKMLGENTMPALVEKPVEFKVMYTKNPALHSVVGFRRHKINAPNPWEILGLGIISKFFEDEHKYENVFWEANVDESEVSVFYCDDHIKLKFNMFTEKITIVNYVTLGDVLSNLGGFFLAV